MYKWKRDKNIFTKITLSTIDKFTLTINKKVEYVQLKVMQLALIKNSNNFIFKI
jgi:hypothetical protein